jgi:hypothetical protein
MLRSSDDKDLVAGLMDGLPLYTAFKPGETDLQSALDEAFAIARPWARGSTTLVVISDGDLSKPVNPGRRPASIADAIVIGVGDPGRPTVLAGHASRQDAWTLKALAGRLDGMYHDGNVRHLPSDVLGRLTSIAPRTASGVAGTSSWTMAKARITKPGVQKPHCRAWCWLKHCCITCKAWSLGATPSIVSTDWLAHCIAKRLHDLMAWSLTNTVQAPHWAVSQPWCVPVSWHCSRSTSISKDDGATSSDRKEKHCNGIGSGGACVT